MRDVVIYRNNLFRISEPFIVQQAQQLRHFRPVYLGRLRYGAAPDGADSLALQDVAGPGRPFRIAWQTITRNPASLLRLIGDRRPALVHAHFGIDGVYALPLARRLNVPLITTFHGFDATLATGVLMASPAWINYPLFRRRLARHGSLFLCVSSFIRDRVLRLGFPEDRTHVHYIGIDTQAIQPRPEPAGEKPVILHVGRLVKLKGGRYLVRAFDKVARENPDVELVIIGAGPEARPLQNLVRDLGIGARVRFLGARPHAEVLSWMRRATMLVLPSVRTGTGRSEGLGMVLLEAAAHGVPAIGTRHGGIPEAIEDGRSGCLVAERDIDGLAACIGDLLADPERRLRMGRAARALVERRFDMRRQIATLERFYESALTGANRTDGGDRRFAGSC